MERKIKKEGKYEIFRTTKEHEILVLNEKEYYAIVRGQKSPLLVKSDSKHEKDKTLQKGKFYYLDFKDDPVYNDTPHLFLEKGEKFEEFILPNDFPTKNNPSKRLVIVKEELPAEKIEDTLKKKKIINKNQKRTSQNRSPKSGKGRSASLNEKTKNELYEMAKKKNIPNRSKMNKEELLNNLRNGK